MLEPAELAAVWESLGDVSELAGRYADAVDAYRNARRAAEPALGPQPGLLHKEGRVREWMSQYSEALRWYTRGLAAAEGLADETERRAHRTKLTLAYAGVRLRQGLWGDCIRRCRAALEDAQDAGDLRSTAHAYYLMHLAYTELASPDREALRGLALPIYEELGDLLGQANVLNNLGIDAYYEGRWDEALDLYRRSREARERIGDVVGAATITNNIGEIESDQGFLDEAEAAFREAYDVCLAAGPPAHLPRRDEQPRAAGRARGPARRGRGVAPDGARRLRGDPRDRLRARDRGAARRARPLRRRPRVGVREGDRGARAHARRARRSPTCGRSSSASAARRCSARATSPAPASASTRACASHARSASTTRPRSPSTCSPRSSGGRATSVEADRLAAESAAVLDRLGVVRAHRLPT